MNAFLSKNDCIRNRILLLSLGVVLLFIILLIIVYTTYIRTRILEHAQNDLHQANESIRNIVYESASSSIKNRLRGALNQNLLLLKERYPIHTRSEENREKAARFLLTKKIGESGYYYIINSKGIVLYHPQKELVGRDVTNFDFIKRQIQDKNGYLEYRWKNPHEVIERDKVLYMDYIPEWDWIVSATAYKSEFPDIVTVSDFRDSIKSYRFGKSGYSFVMNGEGLLLIHPYYEGKYLYDITESGGFNVYSFIYSKKRGMYRYKWQNPNENMSRDKIVLFDYIDEFGWYVASIAYIGEYNSQLIAVRNVILAIIGVYLITIFISVYMLEKSVGWPLHRLVHVMDTGNSKHAPLNVSRGWPWEIRRLYHGFSRFTEMIQTKTDELLETNRQIQVLAHFADDNPNPVFRLRKDLVPVYANAKGKQLLQRLGISLGEKMPEEYHRMVASVAESGVARDITQDGYTFLITLSWIEEIGEYYLFALDVSDLRKFASQVILSESIFEKSVEGICVTDKHGNIERVNKAFERITGFTEQEVRGKNPRILKSDYHDPSFYRKMWEELGKSGTWCGEIWNRRKNGESYPEYLIIQAVKNNDGETDKYLALFHDTSEIKSKEEKIKLYQYYDVLTSLPNKSLFFDRLAFAMDQARRSGKHVVLMLVDIDNYKKINDTFGYSAGDEMIQSISLYLQSLLDDDVLLARIEGNKFAVMIMDRNADKRVAELTSRIYSRENYEVILNETKLYLTFSIGISVFPEDNEDPSALFRSAELALYDVKRNGKNGYKMYNENMQRRAVHRIQIESQLKNAMESGEMFLLFQPQVTMDNRLFGFESLIRWNHRGTIIPPDEFISVAEETGLVKEIGQFALNRSAALIKRIENRYGISVKGAVNISGSHFSDRSLISTIEKSVNEHDIASKLLDVEITERTSVQNIEMSLERMHEIVDAGCSISIDDFGTGYSSLNYLSLFPITYLKIDRSFIQKIGHSEQSDNLVTSIISLAHSLKLKVISEGVETQEQWDFLAHNQCDYIQGFLVSRPITEEDFMMFVEKNVVGKV